MVDQLSSFADEVTRWRAKSVPRASSAVRRRSPGAAGTWRDLTDNVNQLAANLTYAGPRHRRGVDRRHSGRPHPAITVEAQGEVAELKDTINQMIANLRDTTQANAEQDWLKTNLASSSG